MERIDSRGPRPHGPGEAPDARGVDEPPRNRPGVPMEATPAPAPGAHWDTPSRQRSDVEHLHRKGLDRLTPVHGTAQPPRGLSGVMRRAAYRIPEHAATHWMMLLLADRVDVLEHRLSGDFGPDTLDAMRRRVKTNPLPALLLGVAAGVALRRALR